MRGEVRNRTGDPPLKVLHHHRLTLLITARQRDARGPSGATSEQPADPSGAGSRLAAGPGRVRRLKNVTESPRAP